MRAPPHTSRLYFCGATFAVVRKKQTTVSFQLKVDRSGTARQTMAAETSLRDLPARGLDPDDIMNRSERNYPGVGAALAQVKRSWQVRHLPRHTWEGDDR